MQPTPPLNPSALAGLGEDPADLDSDLHPYLRLLQAISQPPDPSTGGYLELAQRRLRTQRLTPGGLPQPPELAGVDADARVPNALQPMAGEYAGGAQVAQGAPSFHNPSLPPATGVASAETAAPGILQQARGASSAVDPAVLAGLGRIQIAPVGNERRDNPVPPPQALARLQEGVLTTFHNGQVWTRRAGQALRVR